MDALAADQALKLSYIGSRSRALLLATGFSTQEPPARSCDNFPRLRRRRSYSGQSLNLASMIDGIARRLVMGEKIESLRIVVVYCRHRLIGVGNVTARSDTAIDAEDLPSGESDPRVLEHPLQ